MPPNNAPIPPRRKPTGTTQLPLSRIKKMIMLDQDIQVCATSSAFTIAVATEMFIQYMAEQGHNVVKSEKKPRRNIQYRDLSAAVSRLDNLEFLSDIVPRTMPFAAAKATKPPTTTSTNASRPSSIPQAIPPPLDPTTASNIAAHTANSNRPYESPFAPNGNGVLNGVIGTNSNGGSGSGSGGGFNAVNGAGANGNGVRAEADAREQGPNAQLELESRRRSSGANGGGGGSLHDIEMS